MARVFIGRPRYKPAVEDAGRFAAHASTAHVVEIGQVASALLAMNCNSLLAWALNGGYDWFGLLHHDIAPERGWVDRQIEEATKQGADLISAVVPFKGDTGLTSTAVYTPHNVLRLTQWQVRHPSFPDTFDAAAAVRALAELPDPLAVALAEPVTLWCNTGCFLCRLHRDLDWTRVCFATEDCLVRNPLGRYGVHHQPEDFVFTQRYAAAGGRVFATRVVGLVHVDESTGKQYSSTATWGQPRDFEGGKGDKSGLTSFQVRNS